MSLYLGELSGSRIFLYGTGLTQVGDNYEPSFETWDVTPAQEVGDCVFRSLGLSFSYTNGYAIGLTPIVDGVAQPESTFNGSGSGTNGQAQVFMAVRGARIAASVRCLSRTGNLTFYNLQYSYVGIRQWP